MEKINVCDVWRIIDWLKWFLQCMIMYDSWGVQNWIVACNSKFSASFQFIRPSFNRCSSLFQIVVFRCGCKKSVVLLQQWTQSLGMERLLSKAVIWPLWRRFPCDWNRWRTFKKSRNQWKWCPQPSKFYLVAELCRISIIIRFHFC